MRDLHHAGVVALVLGFVDDVAPPADHGVEHADARRPRTPAARAANILCIHVISADREHEGRDRADDRPRARIHQMVVVVLGVSVGHRLGLRLRSACEFVRRRCLRDPRPACRLAQPRRT